MIEAIINRYQSEPFVWGKTDCCRFVCECVKAVTGRDLSAHLQWNDHASAQDLVASYGSLSKLVQKELGASTVHPKDGDVCLTVYMGQEILGVVYGNHGVFRTENGLKRLPLSRVLSIWSV